MSDHNKLELPINPETDSVTDVHEGAESHQDDHIQPEIDQTSAQANTKKWYASKTAKIASIGGAIAIAFGAGTALNQSGEASGESPVIAEESDDSESGTLNEQPEENTTESTDNSTEAQENDTENESFETDRPAEYEPILMNADTPRELLDQFNHNTDCIFNSPNYQQQLDCVRFLLGDADGSLTQQYRDTALRASQYRIHEDPDWVYESSLEVIDSTYDLDEQIGTGVLRGEVEFLVRLTDSNGADEIQRLRLNQVLATNITTREDSLSQETSEEFVWVLTSKRQAEPGTSLNIG